MKICPLALRHSLLSTLVDLEIDLGEARNGETNRDQYGSDREQASFDEDGGCHKLSVVLPDTAGRKSGVSKMEPCDLERSD